MVTAPATEQYQNITNNQLVTHWSPPINAAALIRHQCPCHHTSINHASSIPRVTRVRQARTMEGQCASRYHHHITRHANNCIEWSEYHAPNIRHHHHQYVNISSRYRINNVGILTITGHRIRIQFVTINNNNQSSTMYQ